MNIQKAIVRSLLMAAGISTTVAHPTQPERKQVFIFLFPFGEFVASNFSGR